MERQAGLPAGVSQLVVPLGLREREPELDYACTAGHGVEVEAFWLPEVLDDAARCAEAVAWYQAHLPRVPGPVSVHGAFLDLHPYSPDPKAIALAEARVTRCLDLAEETGAQQVVFHCDFNSQVRGAEYPPRWRKGQAEFWRRVMAGRALMLLIENMWNPEPALLAEAVEEIDLDSVGVCLDTGHVHLHSQLTLPQWVEVLGARIRWLHLSDNDGTADQHLAPGKGTIAWEPFFAALEQHGVCVPAVLEMGGQLADVVEAARRLTGLHVVEAGSTSTGRRPR